MIHARNYGQAEEEKATIDLTEEEKEMELKLIVSEEKSQLQYLYARYSFWSIKLW